jgi:hypothetical protein
VQWFAASVDMHVWTFGYARPLYSVWGTSVVCAMRSTTSAGSMILLSCSRLCLASCEKRAGSLLSKWRQRSQIQDLHNTAAALPASERKGNAMPIACQEAPCAVDWTRRSSADGSRWI